MKKLVQAAVVLFILSLGLGAASLLRGAGERTPVVPPAPVVPVVQALDVERVDVPLVVTAQGTVRPRRESVLVPEVSGKLIWVAPELIAGGFFAEGEVLLKIDPDDYSLAVVTAEASVAEAQLRLELERADGEVARKEWEQLAETEANALALREPQLENARAQLKAAEARLERARRDLARTKIKAPYDGRVREENVALGQFVSRGQTLAAIHAIDRVEVRLPLPDSELAFLDVPLSFSGQDGPKALPPVRLRARFAGTVHTWHAEFVRTEGELDPRSRMVSAVVEVRDPYERGVDLERPPLVVGMYVEADIAGRVARDVVVLPRSCFRGESSVLVLQEEDGKLTLSSRKVDVLRMSGDDVIVSGGLQDGERVCLTQLDAVTEGMEVRTADAAGRDAGSRTAHGAGLGS